jgi:hypothetical protein
MISLSCKKYEFFFLFFRCKKNFFFHFMRLENRCFLSNFVSAKKTLFMMQKKLFKLQVTAISPVDGRCRSKTIALAGYCSEPDKSPTRKDIGMLLSRTSAGGGNEKIWRNTLPEHQDTIKP